MKITESKLANTLKGALSPAYLVAGEDILLRNEACDAIRSAARKKGYAGRECHEADRQFDWSAWLDSCNSLSLFAERRIIELRLDSAKIGTVGSDAICQYMQHPPDDALLLIIAPRIEKAQDKTRWIKSIIDNGTYLHVYTPEGNDLFKWLGQRSKQAGLELSRDATAVLAERIEGNLLSAVQEIEKLSLLLPPSSKVDSSVIRGAVADSSRFSAFDMLNHAMSGDALSSCRALRHLRDEGTEVPAIIGAVANELRRLLVLKDYEARRQLDLGFKHQGVIFKNKPAVSAAVDRLDKTRLEQLLQLAAEADLMSKSKDRLLSWDLLEIIVLGIGGKIPATGKLALDRIA